MAWKESALADLRLPGDGHEGRGCHTFMAVVVASSRPQSTYVGMLKLDYVQAQKYRSAVKGSTLIATGNVALLRLAGPSICWTKAPNLWLMPIRR